MSTVSFGFSVNETTKRNRNALLKSASAIADVDNCSVVRTTLERGDDVEVTPKRLFALDTNSVPILIHVVRGSDSFDFTVDTCILLPFSEDEEITITISNPSDNEILLPAQVSYVSV